MRNIVSLTTCMMHCYEDLMTVEPIVHPKFQPRRSSSSVTGALINPIHLSRHAIT
jgi:hypothetical protein